MEVQNLTEWQKSQLSDLDHAGIDCLVNSWNVSTQSPLPGLHCNVTWDKIYCWPPTLAGQTVKRPCSEVMKDDVHMDASNINENGTWLWDHWTNYNDCISAIEDQLMGNNVHVQNVIIIKTVVCYVLFIGSILSLTSLSVSLFIYYYFRSVRCSRVTVQVHLMLSLALRYVLLIVISEPYVFQRTTYHYRSINWLCKLVFGVQFYAKIASINWMFVQGHYLHARLTTNVFNKDCPPLFKYCAFGWGAPFIIVAVWSIVMELNLETDCWRGYGQEIYIWIITGPLLAVLLTNIALFANILRIMLTKIQLTSNESGLKQIRRAIRATCYLSPLMGLNFLIFLPNPGEGGTCEAYYMLINAIIQTLQGLLVSIFHCFMSKDVNDALRRHFNWLVGQVQCQQSPLTNDTNNLTPQYSGCTLWRRS